MVDRLLGAKQQELKPAVAQIKVYASHVLHSIFIAREKSGEDISVHQANSSSTVKQSARLASFARR